jgi:hypothetical protein
MPESTTVERIWRCANCGHEIPLGPLDHRKTKPPYANAVTHACAPEQLGIMHLVERERVYASEAERLIIEKFEASDWGLMAQAVRHYKRNRQSAARRPGVDAVMAGVYARFDGLVRACGYMARQAPRDTPEGGRIAQETFASTGQGS